MAVDVDDVLRDIARAVVEAKRAQTEFLRLELAGIGQRRKIMSTLSDSIDAVTASINNLDAQAPGAITAAIAAAAASGGGTPAVDQAAVASVATLTTAVNKTIADLQAAVGGTTTL